MKKPITATLFSLVFLTAWNVRAQQSPEAVAQAYVDAIRTKGMTATTDFIHPDELKRFKEMLLPILTDTNSPASPKLAQAFFGQSATTESVKSMDPASFMRGFMAATEGQMRGMNITVGDSQILGSVPEGDTIHLVTRNTVGAGSIQLTQLEVVSLKPYQDTWRVLLSGKFEGMAQALKAQAAKPQ